MWDKQGTRQVPCQRQPDRLQVVLADTFQIGIFVVRQREICEALHQVLGLKSRRVRHRKGTWISNRVLKQRTAAKKEHGSSVHKPCTEAYLFHVKHRF